MARKMLYILVMLGRAFKSRALVEGKRYAKDQMVFLREFCQNARDALSTAIRVTTRRDEDGGLDLVFEDNGRGMSFEHAKRYLFTLYASSKEQESESAGRFGVGFWSVLLSNPKTITISSKAVKGIPWRIRMDGDLQSLKEMPPDMTSAGTRIIVSYEDTDVTELDKREEDALVALKRYCRFLRRSDRVDAPLPLFFNERRVDRPMTLESPCWMSFQERFMEGAVGVAESPGVEIYARGLPVWQGTVLEELKYGAKRQTPMQLPKGFAPYYLINGHKLNVTYDRRAVVDDRALRQLRRSAKLKMEELLRRYLDQVSPRPLHTRFFDGVKRGLKTAYIEHRGLSIIVMFLMLSALVIRFWPVSVFNTSKSSPPSTAGANAPIIHRPLGNPLTYTGPTTELQSEQSRLGLVYAPKIDTAFRIAAMEALDRSTGIHATPSAAAAAYPSYECRASCLNVAVTLNAEAGVVVLPVPTGYGVEPGSVRLADTPIPLYLSDKGEPVIRLDQPASSHLVYRTGPARIPPAQGRIDDLRVIPPDMKPPPLLHSFLETVSRNADRPSVIQTAVAYVKAFVTYDASLDVSSQYEQFVRRKGRKDWMGFVFELRRGDCDVKNTLLVYILRRLGIPARLAVGPVGEAGVATPLMHAWVEYYDNGWRVADATGGRPHQSTAVTIDTGSPNLSSVEPTAAASVMVPPMPDTQPQSSLETTSSDVNSVGFTSDLRREIRRSRTLKTVFVVAFVLGALVIVSALFISGKSGRMTTPTDPHDRKVVAAKIAAGALAFPEWWNMGEGIKQRPLLPCLSGMPAISLANAEALADGGALFVASEPCDWLSKAKEAGAVVLDGNAEIFKQVGALLPAVNDLNELTDLSPITPSKIPKPFARVRLIVESINEVFQSAGMSNVALRVTLNPRHHIIHDLNLAALKERPGHLVVVSHMDSIFGTEDDSRPLGLIVYDAIRRLSDQSDLLMPHRSRLLNVAAGGVFGVHR